MNYSPLRYPGGKSRITPIVKLMIERLELENVTYVEPFVGGGGVALSLLLQGFADKIIINDFDIAIYSFWRAITTQPDEFVRMIRNTPITIEQWRIQKNIYNTQNGYSIELGFAAFFLNRTNRSGILKAGPIGGYEQTGKYKIDARFNKEKLIQKIERIARYRENITVSNVEIRDFIRLNRDLWCANTFIYFDPPYVNKADGLYKNFFNQNDHSEIAEIINGLEVHWMLTYDETELVKRLYNGNSVGKISLNYSAAHSGSKDEMIYLSGDFFPSEESLQRIKTKIKLTRGEN